ncbi:unnamed protein product [Macrosiphum euphorbiae]|nr:unnamed protein product [Macrosiphum euphorbiae]
MSSSDESDDLDPGYSIMPITLSASHAISISETFIPSTTNNENMVHYTNLLPLSTLGTMTNNIPATVTSGALTNNIPGTVTSNKSQDSQELLYSTNINDELLSNFNELVSSQHNISEINGISPQS